jgi:outer membrane protein with glycine zipper
MIDGHRTFQMPAKHLALSIYGAWHRPCCSLQRPKTADSKNPKDGETKMDRYTNAISLQIFALILAVSMLAACSGGPMTTREKGAGIGALGGAAAGGIIGATVGHPGAGAAIGGALGLGAGALVGDYMQGQEQSQYQQNQQQIQQNQREIERNRQESQRLRQTEY